MPDGEHVLVAGPARSGRSTALIRLVAGWRDAHAGGIVVLCCPRSTSPASAWVRVAMPDAWSSRPTSSRSSPPSETSRDASWLPSTTPSASPTPAAGSPACVAERHPNVTVVAAGRPDALRTMYGHWTAVVRRSRIGLVHVDGCRHRRRLFGEPLPRRLAGTPRPGLAWMIDAAGRRLVQVGRQPAVGDVGSSPSPRPNASRHDTRLPPLRIDRE